MRRFALIVTLAIFASFAWVSAAFAFGTDLNTIPTTEILDEGTFEWDLNLAASDQTFVAFWDEDGRFLSQRFFSTILPGFEMGMAFNGERAMGPFTLYGKYQIFNEAVDDFPVSVAVGVDNVIGTSDRNVSEIIPYIVIGKNFRGDWNGYLGFAHNASTIQDDDSLFGGLSYDWDENWTFKADYYGLYDNEEAIISGGAAYDLMNHFRVEAWGSYDTVNQNTIAVVELAFTGKFDDLKAEV